jgi:uncharacterized membrane protein
MNARSELLQRLADSTPARMLEPLYAQLGAALERSGLAERVRAESLLGHTAHPVVTDVPIGLWTATSVLDVLGGRKSRRAATTLCSLGVLTAAPTAITGLADLEQLDGQERRLGVVHAAGNALAVIFYTESTWRRLRGHHFRGAISALLGAATMTAAGYIGGELALNRATAARMPATAPGTATAHQNTTMTGGRTHG